MIPNIHQSVDEIIKQSSPAQKILWQQIRLITGENAAVQQMYFLGALAGTPFLTYVARTLYIAYELAIGGNVYSSSSTYTRLYNENNILVFTMPEGQNTYWNTTTTAPVRDNLTIKSEINNVYFSRLVVSAHTDLKFIGYKIVY